MENIFKNPTTALVLIFFGGEVPFLGYLHRVFAVIVMWVAWP